MKFFAAPLSEPRSAVLSIFRSLVLVPTALLAGCGEDSARAAIEVKQKTAGGAEFVVRVQPAERREVTPDELRRAGAILDKRLDPHRAIGVTITPQDDNRLEVFVPGMTEAEAKAAKEVMEKVARLQFRQTGPEGVQPVTADDPEIRPGYVKLPYLDKAQQHLPPTQRSKFVWVRNKAELSGKSIKQAHPDLMPGASSFNILVELHEEFDEAMRKLTKGLVGQPLAICVENLPGEFEVISAPVVMTEFGAQFQISGRYDELEARTLASQLMNPLENPVIVEQTTIIPPAAPRTP